MVEARRLTDETLGSRGPFVQASTKYVAPPKMMADLLLTESDDKIAALTSVVKPKNAPDSDASKYKFTESVDDILSQGFVQEYYNN